MYSNSSLSNHINYQHLSDESEVNMVTSNINSGRIIHETHSNEATNHLDLAGDYSNGGNIQIVNYLQPGEILHHQKLIKLDANYLQSKDQMHGHEETNQSQSEQASLPLLTPLKYVEYQNSISATVIEEQIIMAEESDKSDCESGEHELHKTPSKLPHKKRIAKKLNSSQPYNIQQEQFTVIMPAEDANMRSMQQTSVHHFECNICGAGILDQLTFFMHLKQHYEPPMQIVNMKRKHHPRDESECDQDANMMIQYRELIPEKLIETFDDSQGNIKNEEIQREVLPEIDEFNEFSEPEDMMEDLRKEVEKVVETIEDNECLPESSWQNYQVQEQIEEQDEQSEQILYSKTLIQNAVDSSLDSNYEEIENHEQQEIVEDDQQSIHENIDTRNFDSEEDEEDDQPLEQVRQTLQKSIKSESEAKRSHTEDDKEDLELTECLKKIHNFKCLSCNKAFNSRTALGYHLKTHTSERRYVCEQCGKKFLTNGALKVHLRLHTDDRPYACLFPDCGKSFRQWGDLKYHETSIHSDKKDHVCEFCAKAFARKYSLVIHRRIHTGERNYKCTDCDKSFRASSYLLNHKRIHTGEKPYSCNVVSCQKKFRVVGDLKRHMKIHERTKTGTVKEKKQNALPNAKKKEEAPAEEYINEECVDLSLKQDQEKSTTVNSEVDGFSKTPNGKEETLKKTRKSIKSRKAK